MIEYRYTVWRGIVVELKRTPPNPFWYDPDGVIVALENPSSADLEVRCGVGVLSLPTTHPLTSACRSHDYMYNSPVYQTFHTREQADEELCRLIRIVGKGKWYGFLARPFYVLASLFGAKYWEEPRTK